MQHNKNELKLFLIWSSNNYYCPYLALGAREPGYARTTSQEFILVGTLIFVSK